MKKLVYTLTAIAALLSSCVKSSDEQIFVEKKSTITIEALAAESRTYVEGTEIHWAEKGEQLNIIYFADESTTRRQSATHEDYTLKNNCAEFTADFTTTDGAAKYTFGAFYPYASKSTTSSVSLTVPQEQTPTETSYDPLADILVSENPVVTETVPSKISFKFARMVAFAKMTLVGIPAGEKIEKVVFSSVAKPAGAVEFKVQEQGTLENAKWYNNYEDITLNLGGRTATGEDVVWFVTVPTDLSGTSFTVTVATDRANYTKSVDLAGKTLNFERADVAQFRVTDLVEQQKPLAYKLLTDASELTAGDQFIIATKSYATSSARAISTIASGTKLVHTDSFAIEDGPQIITLPENVALFTVEKGATEGSLAFKTSEGYLYGNYDSDAWANTLSFKATVDDEASWVVTVDSSNKASIFNEKYSRYVNYYSSSSFNFANSASSTYIYYIDGAATEEPETPENPENPVVTPLEAPVVTATATANTVTVEWTAVEGAKDYTVVCGEQSVTVAATTATFENVAAGSYKVVVTANPADETLHIATTSTAVEVVVEDAPAEGGQPQTITLAFPADMPADVRSGNSVGTIYSGDVIISSTGSWRTNNTDGRDCIYIGRNTSNDLRIEAQNGKVITKVTLTAPVGYLVDLKWKEHDGFTSGTYSNSWSGECKSCIVFTTAGASHSNIESITVEYK